MNTEDHVIATYVRTLQQQSKFKAKVIYTLSCIRNYLADTTNPNYLPNIHTLSTHHSLLLTLITLHPDSAILEQVAFFFYLFEKQQICNLNTCEEFLNCLGKLPLDPELELTDQFLGYVKGILGFLRHQYQGVKDICMKLLRSQRIKGDQVATVVGVLRDISWINLDEALQLAKLALPAQPVLSFIWKNCLKTNSNKFIPAIEKILNQYIDQNWHNDAIKYLCMNIAIACSLTDQATIQALSPSFINMFFHNNPKPFYLTYCPQPNKINFNAALPLILHHFSRESLCSATKMSMKPLETIFPQLKSNQELYNLTQAVVENGPLPITLLQKYREIVPIQCIDANGHGGIGRNIMLEMLNKGKSFEKSFNVLEKLMGKLWNGGKWENEEGVHPLCLFLLQFALKNKSHVYLKKIQLVIASSICNFASLQTLIRSNPNYLLFLPSVLPSINSVPPQHFQLLSKQLDMYINSEQPHMCYKFYLAQKLIKWQYRSGVNKFIYYLLRKLSSDHLPYQEIAFYLRKCQWSKEDLAWLQENFQEEMERILEKIFVRLVEPEFRDAKLIIFALEKHGIFEHWSNIYRWVLNSLDEPEFSNPEALIDSLEVFQTVIQKCKNIPIELIKKFFSIVAKNWEHYNHHHMFTIERIANILFAEELSTQNLQAISHHLKSLPGRPWKTSTPGLYATSLEILVKKSLLEETYALQQSLINKLTSHLTSINLETQPFKNYQKLKETLFCLELLMWSYQYKQEAINNKIGEVIMKILNGFDRLEIINEKDKELLVENCLQIISSVPHNCNLLDIQLLVLLRRYLGNKNVINFTIDIVCSIKQANMKAISKFKLEPIIPLILCSLLAGPSDQLCEVYVSLVDELCKDKESPYYLSMDKYGQIFVEIVRSEALFISEDYREEVVFFVMDWVQCLGIEKQISKQWIKKIWLKYYDNQGIRELCESLCNQLANKKKSMQLKKIQITDYKESEKKEINQVKIERQQPIKVQTPPSEPKLEERRSRSPQKEQQVVKVNDSFQKVIKKKEKEVAQPVKVEQVRQPEPIPKEKEVSSPQPPGPKSPQKKNSAELQKNVKPNPFASANKKKRGQANEEQTQYMNNIKGHVNYIESLANVKANEEQLEKLREAFAYLGDVACLHSYYCQKIVNLGIVGKTLALEEEVQGTLLDKILDLFMVVSENNEKNLVIFSDQEATNFFKKQLKASLVAKKELSQNSQIIHIMKNSWNSSNDFFSSGLLSMLFQMCKLSLNLQDTLRLLSESELSYQIVNQIYQRGLFSIMQNTFTIQNAQLTEDQKVEICLWAKLMGKVCLNKSIREKLFSIQLHVVTWGKRAIFEQKKCVENLAFLYSSFCYEFDKIATWSIEEKIPEYFLAQVEAYPDFIPIEYYKFYRYFSQNGIEFISHLFRIKLQVHLLAILPVLNCRIKHEGYKHFYKCLAHFFTPEHYEYFIKAQLIKLLVQRYQEEHSFYILECLQKLVAQLKDKKEVEALAKQNLFSINAIFNTKIKDDLSYPHILQIYTTLFKKFKKFDTKHINLDLANKIIKKSIFSINMEGKKKTVQFLIEFSEVDKIYYGNANCSRLFELLLGYNAGDEEFDLMHKYLEVEAKYKAAVRDSEQARAQEEERYPLRFKKIVDIPCENLISALCDKFIELKKTAESITSEAGEKPRKSMQKILKILKFFNKNEENASLIYEKIGAILIRSSNTVCSFEDSLGLLNELLNWKAVQVRFQSMEGTVMQYLEAVAKEIGTNNSLGKETNEQYGKLLQKCLKNNIIPQQKLQDLSSKALKQLSSSSQPIQNYLKLTEEHKQGTLITNEVKSLLKRGLKVKMYKPDGSNSALILFCTEDLFELHCVVNHGQTVKSKWKLALTEINQIREYKEEDEFKKSVFFLSEGIFTKAPEMNCCLALLGRSNSFYIGFESPSQLKQWKEYIKSARDQALKTLRKVS